MKADDFDDAEVVCGFLFVVNMNQQFASRAVNSACLKKI